MNATRLTAIVLMAAGILGLAYGGFTYTEDRHEAHLGSMSLSIDDRRHVNVPVWAGAGIFLAGGLLFANGMGRS